MFKVAISNIEAEIYSVRLISFAVEMTQFREILITKYLDGQRPACEKSCRSKLILYIELSEGITINYIQMIEKDSADKVLLEKILRIPQLSIINWLLISIHS